jgi:NitT/TauT family transport system ATP-binding protein
VVSHNIEEAVMMADRALIFASDPGRVRAELPITLPRPRDATGPGVRELIDSVYGLMTAGGARPARVTQQEIKLKLGDRLPEAGVANMEGILERLADEPFEGRADLPKLAAETDVTDEELLNLSTALTLLDFVHLDHGDMVMTAIGNEFVTGDNAQRQKVFARQIQEHVPLVAYIRQGLEQHPSGELPEGLFLKLLRYTLNEAEAEHALRVVIEWGRFGNVFEYDLNTGVIKLPEEDEEEQADSEDREGLET